MKLRLKYYLFGAGIGILITVFLYTVMVIPKYKLSDEEIIQKANELSMKQKEDDVDLSALTMTPGPSPTAGETRAAVPGNDRKFRFRKIR